MGDNPQERGYDPNSYFFQYLLAHCTEPGFEYPEVIYPIDNPTSQIAEEKDKVEVKEDKVETRAFAAVPNDDPEEKTNNPGFTSTSLDGEESNGTPKRPRLGEKCEDKRDKYMTERIIPILKGVVAAAETQPEDLIGFLSRFDENQDQH